MSRIYSNCAICQELFTHFLRLYGYSSRNKEQDPAKRYSKAKQPLESGWKEKGIPLEKAEKWIEQSGWIGCVVPPGYILIDIDRKDIGEIVFKSLIKHIKPIVIETPKGYQFVFRDRGLVDKQQTTMLTAGKIPVDYRLAGRGYFVFPTENTENRRFVYVPEKLEDIPPMPLIFTPLRRVKPEDETKQFLDGLIYEKTRNNTLFREFATSVREFLKLYRQDIIEKFGLQKFLLELCLEVNRFFCVPPLEEKEVERLVKSALEQPEREAIKAGKQLSQEEAPQGAQKRKEKRKKGEPEETQGENQEEQQVEVVVEEASLKELFQLDYEPVLKRFFAGEEKESNRVAIFKVKETKEGPVFIPTSPAFVISKIIKIENVLEEAEEENLKLGTEEHLLELSSLEKRAIVNISLEDRKELEKAISNFFGVTFTPQQITMLREYIAEFLWYNEKNIPKVRGVQTTGWYGDEFLIPTVSKDVIWQNEHLLEAYKIRGKFDEELFRKILFTPAGQVVLGALSAPLLNPLELPNYILAVTGLTGTGKTTAVRYAMSLFGNPDKLGVTWFATKAGIEAYVSMHRGLPTWFDEIETMGKNVNEAIDIIYQITSGIGKLRMKKNLTMRKTALLETVPLITMEKNPEMLIAQIKGLRTRPLGLFRRIMEVKADENFFKHYLTGEKVDPREINLYVNRNFGHLGKMYIEFLNNLMKETSLKEELLGFAEEAFKLFVPFELRGLENAYVAQASALWCLEKTGFISKDEKEILLEKLMGNAEENSTTFRENTDIVENFYTAIRDFYLANKKQFYDARFSSADDIDKDRSYLGARFGRDLFLTPTIFEKICREEGFSRPQVLRELDKRGLLKRRETEKKAKIYQTSVRFDGDLHRGYYFLNVFKEDEPIVITTTPSQVSQEQSQRVLEEQIEFVEEEGKLLMPCEFVLKEALKVAGKEDDGLYNAEYVCRHLFIWGDLDLDLEKEKVVRYVDAKDKKEALKEVSQKLKSLLRELATKDEKDPKSRLESLLEGSRISQTSWIKGLKEIASKVHQIVMGLKGETLLTNLPRWYLKLNGDSISIFESELLCILRWLQQKDPDIELKEEKNERGRKGFVVSYKKPSEVLSVSEENYQSKDEEFTEYGKVEIYRNGAFFLVKLIFENSYKLKELVERFLEVPIDVKKYIPLLLEKFPEYFKVENGDLVFYRSAYLPQDLYYSYLLDIIKATKNFLKEYGIEVEQEELQESKLKVLNQEEKTSANEVEEEEDDWYIEF